MTVAVLSVNQRLLRIMVDNKNNRAKRISECRCHSTREYRHGCTACTNPACRTCTDCGVAKCHIHNIYKKIVVEDKLCDAPLTNTMYMAPVVGMPAGHPELGAGAGAAGDAPAPATPNADSLPAAGDVPFANAPSVDAVAPPVVLEGGGAGVDPGEGLTPGEVVFLPAAAAAAAAVAAVPLAADDGAGAAAVDKAAVLAAAAVALELLLASPCAASAAAVAAVDTVAAVPFDPAKAAPEVADNAAKDAAVAAPDAVAAVELAEPFEAAAVGDRAANAAAVAACDAAVVLALLPAVDDSTDKAAADAACCAAVA